VFRGDVLDVEYRSNFYVLVVEVVEKILLRR